jgi:beta-N-acetylhexosaminidase
MATPERGCRRRVPGRRRTAIPAAAGAAALAVALAAAGCGAAPAGQDRGTTSPSQAASRPAVAGPASPVRPATPAGPASPASPSCPAAVYSRMTEAQRVGQLFLVGLATDQLDPATAATIRSDHFGSVLFGTTSYAGVSRTRAVTSAVQSLASTKDTAGVRFFVAANQEGGQVQQLQGPGFAAIPAALDQGLVTPQALQQQAAAWGRELRVAGVNLDLAPVMDVVPPGTDQQNAPIGALQREFGHDPGTVAAHGVAFARGMGQAGVATTAKHFPGLGRVRGNTDFTLNVVDTVTTPDDPYLQSYGAAIRAGVPFVMVSLATYTRIDPTHLAVFSARVMQTMLRQRLRFGGVIVSDDMGAASAVGGVSPAARAIGFLAAGGDLITTVSVPVAAAMDSAVLQRAAQDGTFRGQVGAAVMRVLAAKQAYGLMPYAG